MVSLIDVSTNIDGICKELNHNTEIDFLHRIGRGIVFLSMAWDVHGIKPHLALLRIIVPLRRPSN